MLMLRKALQTLLATTVLGAMACASAQSRDPSTVIADAQCRAWARDMARAEYARDKRAFAAAPNTVMPGVTSPGAAGATYGFAGAGSVLTDLAQQQRERELYSACMAQPQSQPARTQTPSVSEEPRTERPSNSAACDWGEYWSSASGRCQKVKD